MPQDFISKPPYNVVQPGAYSAVNASLLASPNFFAGRPVPAVVGACLGGTPNKPLYFRSPNQLQQVLRGGPAYDVARFLFDGGAPQVAAVRVGNSITQATLNLAGTTGTVATLTAQDWGSWANAITVTVASGPVITLTFTDSLGNVFTEKWDLTGVGGLTVQQVSDAINGKLQGYSGSLFVTSAAGAGTLPLTAVASANLTGGTDGLAPIAGDWTNGLKTLETESVDIVIPATGDATIHAQVQAHCQNMSTPTARNERTCVVGGVLGETVAQAISRIKALPSGRVQLVYPGMYDYNTAGTLTLWDSFYHAAKIVGMHCAQPDVASSLVHQQVPIVDIETKLSTVQGGALDQLLIAGVTPVAPARGSGFWIVDSLTGYNQPDGVFRDMTSTRSADFVAQYARAVLESAFVGSKTLPTTKNAIQQEAVIILDHLTNMKVIFGSLPPIVTPGPNPNSWSVSLPVMLINTTKFIFITVQLQPSSTIQSSTTAADALV